MSAPASTRATEFEWIEQAACKGTDPELFFPRGADEAFGDAAREICRRCPVLATCLSYALHWDVDGVWGATSKAERATLRARHRLTAHPVEIHAPDASLRAQIEAMSRGGASIREISIALRISEHTISYHRAYLRALSEGDRP